MDLQVRWNRVESLQLLGHPLLGAHQDKLHRQGAGRLDGAVHNGARRPVTPMPSTAMRAGIYFFFSVSTESTSRPR